MTINTPTVLAQGGTTTDGNPIATDSIAPSANRFLVAVIYSSHGTAANAVIPASITGLGLAWSFSTRSHIEGNQRVTIATAFTGSTAPTAGPLTVDFGRTMQAMGWHILQFSAAGVDTTTPIVQFGYYDYATTPGANLSFDLPAATTAGNAVLAAETAGSNTITYVAGTGYVQLGDTVPLLTPSLSGAVFWSAGGTRTVAVGSEQAAPSKSLVAIEIKAAAGSPNTPPTAVLTSSKSTVTSGGTFTLDGSGSSDPDGTVASYTFTQTAGPTAALAAVTGHPEQRTVTAPTVTSPTTMTFQLRVTDNTGANSTPVTVNVTAAQAGALLREKTAAGGDAFTATPAGITTTGGRIQVAPADGAATFATWTALALTTGAGCRLVGEFTAYPTGSTVLLGQQNAAGTRAVDVGITAAGKLTIRDAANVLRATMQTAMPLNTKVRVEVITDCDTTATVYLYPAGSTVALDSITYTGPSGTFSDWNTFRVGASALTPAMPLYYIDDVAVKSANALLGPWSGSPTGPTVTLTVSKTTGVKGGEVISLSAAATSSSSTISGYTFTASNGIVLNGTGNMRTLTVPYTTTAQTLTFSVTATDANGLTGTDVKTATTAPLRYPDGGFTLRSGVLLPFIRGAISLTPPSVTINSSAGDSSASIVGTVAPNGNTVDGVYVGRDGTDLNGAGPWESGLIKGLTFSQNFPALINGTTYHLYVTPVVKGVRQTPTTVSVTPQGSPNPPSSAQLLGFYHSAPSADPDGAYKTAYGNYPMSASSYYGASPINETYETTRVQRGTTVFLDFDTKATPGLIGHIADGDATGYAWASPYLTSAQNIANASNAANNGTDVFIGFVHEYDVKVNKGVFTDSRDADPVTFAAAWDQWVQWAQAIAPDCIPIYWTGGFYTSTVATVMANITVPPSAVSWDPYVTNGASFQLPSAKWKSGAQFFTSNADYQQWGSPPLYLTECGVDKRQGDTNCTAFFNDIPNAMKTLGINGVILFSVDKTDTTPNQSTAVEYDIFATTDAVPNAKTAFGTAVSTIRGGGSTPVKPTIVTAPAISGTAKVGTVLSSTTGNWTGTPTSYARQWLAGGVAIVGATASTYTPVTADVGKTLTVRVTATNTAGASLPATSAPTAAVLSNSQPSNTWTQIYDVDLSSELPNVDYNDANGGKRPTVHQGINRKQEVTWGPDGMLITAHRSGPGAEPVAGGPAIYTGDVNLMSINIPQHAAIEWDVTLSGYLGPGMFPASWSRPNGGGEGEKDWWEYCGGNKGAYNEMKTTAITTPYNSAQSSQTVFRWALNVPNYSATADRMTVFGGFHSWRLEMTPGLWVLYRDGIQMKESGRDHLGSDTYAKDNGGSTALWTSQFDTLATKWYPRFTYQIGNGTTNNLAGAIPTSWTQSTFLLSRLKIWKLSSE